MTTYNGYIKLYRDLLSWQWYGNTNVFRLYIHLLLKASFKDFEFEGKSYKAGELITSRKKLAEELSLSEWQILTALDKLKSTGEIAVTTTNKFTVITLKNWQKTEQEQKFFKDKPTSNPQQKHNKSTHLNNIKNEKNVKNNSARPREKKYDIYSGSIDWSLMDMIINN